MNHGPQLITFTRAREESDCWKDGQLRKWGSSPANHREKEGAMEGEEARSFYESLLVSGDRSSLPRKRKAPLRRPGVHEPPVAQPGQTDPRRGNLLLRSAQEGDMGTLRRLLEREGCDVNYRDGYYWTAVMCAAYAGQGEAVRYLLTRGAAWVGVCESQGRDAVDLAEEAGHQDVVRILQERETAQPEERIARCPRGSRGGSWLRAAPSTGAGVSDLASQRADHRQDFPTSRFRNHQTSLESEPPAGGSCGAGASPLSSASVCGSGLYILGMRRTVKKRKYFSRFIPCRTIFFHLQI
ncbi:G patch domain and ankyrin repeat-containing protein 1 isoform 2-T2 [Macrochelys suwanniensis]